MSTKPWPQGSKSCVGGNAAFRDGITNGVDWWVISLSVIDLLPRQVCGEWGHAGLQLPLLQLHGDHRRTELRQEPSSRHATNRVGDEPGATDGLPRGQWRSCSGGRHQRGRAAGQQGGGEGVWPRQGHRDDGQGGVVADAHTRLFLFFNVSNAHFHFIGRYTARAELGNRRSKEVNSLEPIKGQEGYFR